MITLTAAQVDRVAQYSHLWADKGVVQLDEGGNNDELLIEFNNNARRLIHPDGSVWGEDGTLVLGSERDRPGYGRSA